MKLDTDTHFSKRLITNRDSPLLNFLKISGGHVTGCLFVSFRERPEAARPSPYAPPASLPLLIFSLTVSTYSLDVG